MRSLFLLLILLATPVSASGEVPFLIVGGDGHAYARVEDGFLTHLHHDKKTIIGIPRVIQLFRSRSGVIVTTEGLAVWLVERGKPTRLSDGAVMEISTSEDGTYLYIWDEGEKLFLFVP